MAVLDFPEDIKPSDCAWQLIPRTKIFTNPLTNSRQTLSMPGTYWQAQLSFSNLSRDKAARLAALIHKLDGASGRISLWDHAFPKPRGLAQGNPVVDGSNQLGSQLNIKGCTPNSNFLKAGDYCQIGEQLVIMTDDANADGQGRCKLNFKAALRKAPVNGTRIITDKPKAIMMLKDDKQGGRRSSKKLVLSSFSFTLIEDVNT